MHKTMLKTTVQGLLNGEIDVAGYRLYVVKNDAEVLYVGQSVNVRNRIRGHIRDETLLGNAISLNHPHSQHWEVNLYTVEECTDLILRYFPSAPKTSSYSYGTKPRAWGDFAEDALIHDLAPRYNQAINIAQHPYSTPFTKREIHPELQALWETRRAAKEEAESRQQREREEKQAFLIKRVCTICGHHDRWTYTDGQPCGLLSSAVIRTSSHKEGRLVIPLVCHDCNDIINKLSELERKADRVQLVKKAIRKRTEHKPSRPSVKTLEYSQMVLNLTTSSFDDLAEEKSA